MYQRFLVRDRETGDVVARVAASPRHSALDACLRAGVPARTRCRGSLICGVCHVDVLTHADDLEPPGAEEAAMLARTAADRPGARLACQLHIPEGVEEVEIGVTIEGA